MPLFDSHAHLQNERFDGTRAAVLARAREAGVEAILCCAVRESDWESVLSISRDSTVIKVIPALGLHPWFLADRSTDWLWKLEKHLLQTGAAVGEIGLDHAVKPLDKDIQRTVFTDQLRLACRLNRQVSVHCRDAWGSLIEVVRQVGVPDAGLILHSYSGSPELVAVLAGLGCSFSFSGSITRPNHVRAQAAARAVPEDRLLVETDSPDGLPFGMIARHSEPAFIGRVIESVAAIRGLTREEVSDMTWENAALLFPAICGS